jgi:hypothetical protein
VRRLALLAAFLALPACPTQPPPVTPTPDASDAAVPCHVIDEVNASRLIRQPDGSALWVAPCDGGAPTP